MRADPVKGLPEPKDAALRDSERRALMAFYEALGGPDWIQRDFWGSDRPVGEWHGDAGQQTAEPAIGPACSRSLSFRRAPTRTEEVLLELVQVGIVWRCPFEGRGKASASIEVGVVAASLIPGVSRSREVAMERPPFGVLLEPLAQPRPLAEQSLVRHLGGSLGDGDEPRLGQDRHRARRWGITIQIELREGSAAANDARHFTRRSKAEQDPLGGLLLVAIESPVRVFGQPCDCPLHAA